MTPNLKFYPKGIILQTPIRKYSSANQANQQCLVLAILHLALGSGLTLALRQHITKTVTNSAAQVRVKFDKAHFQD